MYHRQDDFGDGVGSAIAMLGLILLLIAAFLVVKAVLFVITTFVKYHKEHKSLWVALAVCVGSSLATGLVYKLTQFTGSGVLACIGIAVLLITCFVVELKNRDTLMRENVNLVASILHPSSWWGLEDKPIQEQKLEPIAA